MKISGVGKFCAVASCVTLVLIAADVVIDRVVSGKKDPREETANQEPAECEDVFEETDSEEETIDTSIVSTVVKTAAKVLIIGTAMAFMYDYGLQNGIVSGAGWFTKVPTTYDEAAFMVTDPDAFRSLMRTIRKVRWF